MKPWIRWSLITVVAAAAVWIFIFNHQPPPMRNSDSAADKGTTDSTRYARVSDKEFAAVLYQQDHEPSSVPTMVELGSKTCIPCRRMEKVMDELRQKYGEHLDIEFYDVKEDIEVARLYRIRVIPTQVFIDTSGREIYRHEGFFPMAEIEPVLVKMGVSVDQ